MMRSPTVAVIIDDVFNAFFSLAYMEPNKQTFVCGLSGIAFLLIAPIYVCHEKFANLDKNSPCSTLEMKIITSKQEAGASG